jgi:hypothetical protein
MYTINNSIDTKISLLTCDVKQEHNIVFNTTGTEMLKVDKDGFYVRGVRVPQDEKEAETVYNAFHQWLTWATLNRNY